MLFLTPDQVDKLADAIDARYLTPIRTAAYSGIASIDS